MTDTEYEPRIEVCLRERLCELTRLLDAGVLGETLSIAHYASAFDYVEAGTVDGQTEGYWRYRVTSGPPCEEFRFFRHPRSGAFRAEYWFLDWNDYFSWKYGDFRDCTGDTTIVRLWSWLTETGAVANAPRLGSHSTKLH